MPKMGLETGHSELGSRSSSGPAPALTATGVVWTEGLSKSGSPTPGCRSCTLSRLAALGPPSFQRGLPVPRPRGALGFASGEGQASSHCEEAAWGG